MKGKKKIIDKATTTTIMTSVSKEMMLKKIQHYLHVNHNNNNNIKIEENYNYVCNSNCSNNDNKNMFLRCNSLYNNCIATCSRNTNDIVSVSNGLVKGKTMSHIHHKHTKSSNINVYKNEYALFNKQQHNHKHKRINSFNNIQLNTNPNTLLLTIPIRNEHNIQQYNNNNNNKTKPISFNHNNNIRDVCSSLKDKTTQTHNAIIEPEHISYFPTEISNINSIPCSKQTQQTPNDNNNNNSYCETTETHMLANMLTIQDNNNTKQQKDPTLNMQSILTKTFNILHKQPQQHKSRNALSSDNDNNNSKEQSIHSKKNFTFGEISIIPHKPPNQNTQTKNSLVDTLWPREQPITNNHHHLNTRPILYYNIKHNYYTINSFKIREAHFKKVFNTKHHNNNNNIKQSRKYSRTINVNVSPLNREYCYKCKQTQFQHKTLEHIIPHKINKNL